PIERTTVEGWSPDMVKAEPAHVRTSDEDRPRRSNPPRRNGNGHGNGARSGARPAAKPRSESSAPRAGNGSGRSGQPASASPARPRNSSARRGNGGPRAALLGSVNAKS